MIRSTTSATFIGRREITEIEVIYSRPLCKGRTIFDGLVPFGRPWRTGANGNTVVSFTSDIFIQGKMLEKGKYALYTVPGPDSWDLIFYRNYRNYGLPRPWVAQDVALKISLESKVTSFHTEVMTINLNVLSDAAGQLEILWENTSVRLDFEIPSQMNQPEALLVGGLPEIDYYCSAEFYGQDGNDLGRALWSISAVTEHHPDLPFYYFWQRAVIEAKAEDWKSAIESAQTALTGAVKAGNKPYANMIQTKVAEWQAR